MIAGCQSLSEMSCRCVQCIQTIREQRRGHHQTATEGDWQLHKIKHLLPCFNPCFQCVNPLIIVCSRCLLGRPAETSVCSPECNSAAVFLRANPELHHTTGKSSPAVALRMLQIQKPRLTVVCVCVCRHLSLLRSDMWPVWCPCRRVFLHGRYGDVFSCEQLH